MAERDSRFVASLFFVAGLLSASAHAVQAPAQEPLSCGQVVTKEELGDFTFTAVGGDMVSITLADENPDVLVVFDLLDPDGAFVEGRSGPVEGRAGFRDIVLPPKDGMYVIQVRNETNDEERVTYTVGLEWLLPAERQCPEERLVCGSFVTGTVVPYGQAIYSFDAFAGERVSFGFANAFGSSGHSVLDLFDPEGMLIAAGIEADRSLHRGRRLPEKDGTYTIRLRSKEYPDPGADHSLSLLWVSPLSRQCSRGQPGDCRNPTEVVDLRAAERHIYNFQAQAEDRVSIAGSSFSLFDPDGRTLPASTQVLPADGIYTVRVPGNRIVTSGYRLSVEVTPFSVPPGQFIRGDCNSDGTIDVSDALFLVNYLFLGGVAPPCPDACDTWDIGVVELSNAIQLFTFLFHGGPPFAPPGPEECGVDPTGDCFMECVQPSCP